MGPAAVAYFASRLHGLYALALADGVEVEVSRVQGVQLMSWPAAGSEQHPGDDSDSVGKGEADSAEVEASKESFMWSELQAWHAAMVAPEESTGERTNIDALGTAGLGLPQPPHFRPKHNWAGQSSFAYAHKFNLFARTRSPSCEPFRSLPARAHVNALATTSHHPPCAVSLNVPNGYNIPSVCAYARWDARFVLPTWTAVAAPTPTRARPRPMAQVHKTQVQTLYLTVG